MTSKSELAANRLRTALELADVAEEMMEMRIRRLHPELSEEEVRARVAAWYEERPGAVHGDAVGIPGQWPRSQ